MKKRQRTRLSTLVHGLISSAIILAIPAVWALEPEMKHVTPYIHFEGDADHIMPEYVPESDGADLINRGRLTVNTTYYGRVRNSSHDKNVFIYYGDIHANIVGIGTRYESGYAWNTIGVNLAAHANIGSENGWTELLNMGNYTRINGEGVFEGRSYATVNEGALKIKQGDSNGGMTAVAGYTPIRIGTIGTSGRLHNHSYRGAEIKGYLPNFEFGYGIADQFHNEWDDRFRNMVASFDQNRRPGVPPAPRISYIHSVGGRYNFGGDRDAFVDFGYGNGKDFRQNAQVVVTYPFKMENQRTLTATGYGYWAKYREKNGAAFIQGDKPANEYHVSFSAEMKAPDWTAMIGYGYTRAPDSWEQQFRVTPWANSDNRNFNQVWAEADSFIWDGQSVIKIGGTYNIGKFFNVRGLTAAGSFNYGWNMKNHPGFPHEGQKGRAREFDYSLHYAVPDGPFKGVFASIYRENFFLKNFSGTDARNDFRVIIGYSKTFDMTKIRASQNKN